MMGLSMFLPAVLADPDDDGPRLVYADWLDDHGDPEYAEFIRLQCRLHGLPEGGPTDDPAARSRADELLLRHGDGWAGPLAGLELTFRRGFADAVGGLDVPTFLDLAEVVFASAPVRGASLSVWDDEHVTDLLASPWARRLRALKLEGIAAEDAGRLAAADCLAGLERLDLTGSRVGREGVLALLGPRSLPSLAWLDVSPDGDKRRVAGGAYVAPEATRPGVRAVNLAAVSLGDGVLASLSGRLGRFEAIDLFGCGIGDEGALALASCTAMSGVGLLNVTSNGISDRGALALARSPNLGGLRHLFAGMNTFDGVGYTSEGGVALCRRFGDGVHFFIH